MTNRDFVCGRIFYDSLPVLSLGVIDGCIERFGGVAGGDFVGDGSDGFDVVGCVCDLLDNMILVLGVSGSVGDSLRLDARGAVRLLRRRRNEVSGGGVDYLISVDELGYVLGDDDVW